MKSSYIFRVALVIILALPTSLSCLQQTGLPQKSFSQKQFQQNSNAQQPNTMWRNTKIFFTGLATAATAVALGWVSMAQYEKYQERSKNAPYEAFKKQLDKAQSLAEMEFIKSQPQWKAIAETEQGKHVALESYKEKLRVLKKDLDEANHKLGYGGNFRIDITDGNINKEYDGEPTLHLALQKNMPLPIIEQIITWGGDITKEDVIKRKPMDILNQEIRDVQKDLKLHSQYEGFQVAQATKLRLQNLLNVQAYLEHQLNLLEKKKNK